MSNKIRAHFKSDVDPLLPALHETYRLIGLFQNDRNPRIQLALHRGHPASDRAYAQQDLAAHKRGSSGQIHKLR